MTFLNEGTFTLTSSVQDLPVILKWHNFQSLEKALNFFMELNFCKSDVYFLNRRTCFTGCVFYFLLFQCFNAELVRTNNIES